MEIKLSKEEVEKIVLDHVKSLNFPVNTCVFSSRYGYEGECQLSFVDPIVEAPKQSD
jgi:hypothetical protein